MAGYTRNDTSNNIADGNVINASDLDGEFDALVAAFDAATGHTHDGTAANGAPITKIGPAQDLVVSTGAITPKTDNTVDLGATNFEFKDLYIDGTANIDSLVADTADINGGTIDGATINGSTNTITNINLTTAVTGTLPVANGGTGAASLTANSVLLGNGTSAVQEVAPGSSGNVLTSNGTTWTSAALPAGGIEYVYKTSTYTATDKQGVLADTTGGSFTVTLPGTPAAGAQVVVADAGGSWQTNNLTIARNGSTIEGVADNLICDISGVSVQLIYSGTTWEVYAQVGGAGGSVVTLDGIQTLTNKTLTSPQLNTATATGLKETKVAIAASDIDLSAGNYFTKTISGTTTFTVSNIASSGTVSAFVLDLTNGGSATVNWFSGVRWPAGTAPTLTASGRDVLAFFTHDGGSIWNGFVLGLDVKAP